jgi:hypothetical protein
MFIGHYGVALAGKAVEPRPSLGVWIMAAQFVDLLWPLFLLLGWEHVRIAPGATRMTPLDFYDYPITHSLVGALGWSVAFGAVSFAVYRHARPALLLGAGVFSHWILDLLVHRRDLPIAPGSSARVGLGLWNYPAATLLIEIPLYLIGAALYLRSTRAKDRTGSYGAWIGLALLLVIYIANMGPPSPSVSAIAYLGLAGWLIVAWGYWVDRHRTEKEENER